MSQFPSSRDYPNVRARLRISREGPGLPDRERVLTIWLRGTRFRVRDESGSHLAEILDDLPGARGLGTPPRSLEGMMDIWSAGQAKKPSGGPTELLGDLASGEGFVKRGQEAAWPKPAGDLAPLAELILAPESNDLLDMVGQEDRLGRAATIYAGRLGDGAAAIDVTRVIARPYLLREEAHDGRNPAHLYVRVIESIDEGIVTGSDLVAN